jgi:hypothetical protein
VHVYNFDISLHAILRTQHHLETTFSFASTISLLPKAVYSVLKIFSKPRLNSRFVVPNLVRFTCPLRTTGLIQTAKMALHTSNLESRNLSADSIMNLVIGILTIIIGILSTVLAWATWRLTRDRARRSRPHSTSFP